MALSLQQIKDNLRAGSTSFPGCYPKYFVASDGEPLSYTAVRDNWEEIVLAHLREDFTSDWLLVAVDINWEDPNLFCAHNNERIVSAYSEE